MLLPLCRSNLCLKSRQLGQGRNLQLLNPRIYKKSTSSSMSKSSQSDHLTASIPTTTVDDDNKLLKRKVALACSYVGSNYHGLQMDVNNDHLPFIEKFLKEALTKSGCISESNSADLKKISWERSSRTDKGVHASRIVISAKLLLHPSWFKDELENYKYFQGKI